MFLLCAGQGDAILPPPSLLGNLVWMILLPFGLGHLLQRPLGAVWQQRKSWVTGLNHAVILFIVWRAFSQSILLETWSEVTTNQFLAVLTGVLILLLVMTAVAWWGSGMIRLDAASRVTALFCGSQKTLALGLPMAGILFEDLPVDLSMLVFPLLLYHPLQLLLAGLLTSPLKQWVIENSETSYEKFPPHRFSSG
jgi:sodium/bile acid cotransporter 7